MAKLVVLAFVATLGVLAWFLEPRSTDTGSGPDQTVRYNPSPPSTAPHRPYTITYGPHTVTSMSLTPQLPVGSVTSACTSSSCFIVTRGPDGRPQFQAGTTTNGH